MPTIAVEKIITLYRRAQDEWWLTPHVVYSVTDDNGNIINGSVTVRKPLAPKDAHSDWLPEDMSGWIAPLNEHFKSVRILQSVMDQYYREQAIDDIVSDTVSSYWHNGPEATR